MLRAGGLMLLNNLIRKISCGILAFLCLTFSHLYAQETKMDHRIFNEILQQYVNEQGEVQYQELKKKGRDKLEQYLHALGIADPGKMSQSEQIAFYINAYNAFTLKLVIDHYPIKSIRKIDGVSGILGTGQWKKIQWKLAGKKITLHELEHEVLRPMGEPLIHFALVCASKSCPNLARTAYTGDYLAIMLEEQARKFNQSPKGVQIEGKGSSSRLKISSIYDWFEKDFQKKTENIPSFIARYANAETRQVIKTRGQDLSISYLDYDWGLNEQKK